MALHNQPVLKQTHPAEFLRLTRRPDLRCANWLGHSIKDHHALAAAARRERFSGIPEATVNVLPVVHRPDVARRIDGDIGLHLQAAAHVPAGRRDLVTRLHARRTVFGLHAAQLHDRAVGHGEVGDPDIVVAIHGHGPRTGKAAADKWRPGILAPVRTEQRDAASIGATCLLGHGADQHFIEIAAALQGFDHVFQNSAASGGVAKTVRHPDIALAVDAEAAAAEACLKGLDFGGIRGGEAGDRVCEGAGYPDAVLLVDAEVERSRKRFARLDP